MWPGWTWRWIALLLWLWCPSCPWGGHPDRGGLPWVVQPAGSMLSLLLGTVVPEAQSEVCPAHGVAAEYGDKGVILAS